MALFTVLPAIDLREGTVVRLMEGDPRRQKVYGEDPASTAKTWIAAGADWLHVVDLDGAFGEAGGHNRSALQAILGTGAQVQFGGGLRTLEDVEQALSLGICRLVLGTLAVESPSILHEAVARFGSEKIVVGIDARDGQVRVRGWTSDGGLDAGSLAQQLYEAGVRTVVHTDIARDGTGKGLNIEAARRLSESTGLRVIVAGGVAVLDEIRQAREAGLAGVIIGRALYEGQISLKEALRC